MSVSGIYILDMRGKVVLSRNYRGDIEMNVIENFLQLLLEREEESRLAPIFQTADVSFVYIKHSDIYLTCTTKINANVAMVLSFLYRCVRVFSEYFHDFQEESVRDNFVIVYELLDELMDFGFPQSTDSKILQEYITQNSHKLEEVRPPSALTNRVSWRSDGIKYSKNEVFLDVVEQLNLLVGSNGKLVRSEVHGLIKMRACLSGMPELRLSLNDKVHLENIHRAKNHGVDLEDVKFHQCVRLSRFENDRTISFIPPDGEFELMSYRLTSQAKPLIAIEYITETFTHSRVEYTIRARSQFRRSSVAANVQVRVPVPSDVDTGRFKTASGSVKYVPEENLMLWTIKSFPGGKELIMRAHFKLPSVRSDEQQAKPPIQVKFEIPFFTVSGINVRYLKAVEKSGYESLSWVRYMTKNGDYQIRTH